MILKQFTQRSVRSEAGLSGAFVLFGTETLGVLIPHGIVSCAWNRMECIVRTVNILLNIFHVQACVDLQSDPGNDLVIWKWIWKWK